MEATSHDRGALAAHAVVSAAVVATFARAVPYPLVLGWDDGRFIADNPLVREPSLESLWEIVSRPHFEAYHPLHLLSYWLDVPWTGAAGPALHTTNAVLWVAAANLLLLALRRLDLSAGPAAIATLACMLHPVQVEAVCWATGRKDALAMLFAAGALALHLRDAGCGGRAAWGARACFVAGALSKTTVLPLPGVMVLADVCLGRARPRDALRRQWPSLLLAAGLAIVVVITWREHSMVRANAGGVAEAPARVAATLWHQTATALWPAHTSPMYSTRAVADPGPAAWLLATACLVGVGVAIRRRARWVGLSLGTFLLLLVPVSNAVPMYFPFQDRYLSLPLLGLAIGLGAALDASHRRAAIAAGAILVAALAARTVQYEGAWQSEARLWGHAASTQPDAFYAWIKLGETRRDANDLYGAIRAYRRAVEVEPSLRLGHSALLLAVALRDEALGHLTPSRAQAYAREFHAAMDDAPRLRKLASLMLTSGHLRALELPLARSLQLSPVDDETLERAAATQFAAGHGSVGAFYLRQMATPTQRPELRARKARAEEAQARSPL